MNPPSCIQLNNDFQVSWTYNDTQIKIRQCGCIGEGNSQAFCILIIIYYIASAKYWALVKSSDWRNIDC